jgi:hypothetical protein
MPGGKYHDFFFPYKAYGQIDHHYSREAFEAGEGFPTAQMWMNLIELTLQMSAFFLFLCGGKKSAYKAAFLAFSAQLMTLSKTMLYFACDIASNFKYTNLSMFPEVIYLYYIPNGCWIVFPFLMVWTYGSAILNALAATTGNAKQHRE